MSAPIVFFDIARPDWRVSPPYAAVFGWDVAASLQALVAHGGQMIAPRFEAPAVVVLGLFTDPAGNRMGLVEMDGDRAKIP